MDPLSALRDFAVRGELDSIVLSGEDLRFGSDYIFPRSAETAYRSKQGPFYTLDTLLHFLRHHHLKHTDYLQSARLLRLPHVTLPDRKALLDFLTGKLSSTSAVEYPTLTATAVVEEYRPSSPYAAAIRAFDRALDRSLGCNFLDLLEANARRDEERHRLELQQRKDGLVANSCIMGTDDHQRGLGGGDDIAYKGTPRTKINMMGSKIGEGVPIILVPSASQTLITIYNVKEFLEDGLFVPTETKLKAMQGGAVAKPDCVTVQKKLSRDSMVTAYEVRDKTSALKKDDWDRVVAVFVLGKEWQFEDWPFKDHVEIFNKIIGFYVRFEDDSVESAKIVKQWNVKIVSISKNKRHQDRAAALEVWDRLEEFVQSRSLT